MRWISVGASIAAILGCGDNLSSSSRDGGADSGDGSAAADGSPADASPDGSTPPPPPDPEFTFACPPGGTITVADLRMERVASGLTQPVLVTAPASDSRLFVVEQPGRIRIIENDQLVATPYLDITDRVKNAGSEEGLLGLAFHPDFASNGKLYVHYIRDVTDQSADETVIAEFTASSAADDTLSPASELVLFTVTQPASNHNGGMIAFGPVDNYLYIALGDGGSAGDPSEHGQNPMTYFGSLLRIDIDAADAPLLYAIPDDNPFADGVAGAAEVYAFGLRNPWRFSFDRTTGDIYIGDVGQFRVEEINAVEDGSLESANFGWDVYEGSECFADNGTNTSPGTGCSPTGLVAPIAEYGHSGFGLTPPPSDPAGGAVTGGYVYRGTCMPDIQGTYFYADFSSGIVRTLEWNGTVTSNTQDISSSIRTDWAVNPASNIASFGEDSAGELYIVSYAGSVFRIGAE